MRGLLFFVIFLVGMGFVFASPFYGVMAWYVFSLGNPHRLAYGFFSTLPYAYIIAGLTFLCWLTSRRDPVRIPFTPLVVLTLLFSLWMTVTSVFAAAPADSVWDKWTEVHKVLLMAVVGYALTTSRQRINLLIWTVVLSIGFWGVKGGISSIASGGVYRVWGPEGTAIGDNNELGLALVMILPLIYYLWQTVEKRYLRLGLLGMGFLVSIAVFFTYSRGAFLGLCAMGLVFWVRSRAKVMSAVIILAAGLFVYNFAPEAWFARMNTIETYDQDESAMSRIYLWHVGARIAAQRPLVGGGFKVTFWPDVANTFLAGSDLPPLTRPRAEHSIYFDVLSEHGYVGLAIFLAIGLCAWINVSRLVRDSSGRPDLLWANQLGRLGQGLLIGFWVGGSTMSLAYYDGYWCVLFLLEAARRVLAAEAADAKNRTGSGELSRAAAGAVPAPFKHA